MKYIIFEVLVGSMKMKMPFIFPDIFVHKDIAQIIIQQIHLQFKTKSIEIFSAGDFNPMSMECSGESSTLKIKSNPDDSETIRMFEYLRGM